MRIFALLLTLGLPFAAAADNHPSYQNGILTLPRVDTPAQVAKYRDAALHHIALGDDLKVMEYKEYRPGEIYRSALDVPEIVVTSTTPATAYWRIAGSYGCGRDYVRSGRFHQRRNLRHFDLDFTVQYDASYRPDEIVCSPSTGADFRMTLPLEIYGLDAGIYTYRIGERTAAFVLRADNRFADDRDFGSGAPLWDQPDYQDGALTLPRVDTPNQVGQFQDVRLEATPEGKWRIAAGHDLDDGRFVRVNVERVETVITPGRPANVYLRASGVHPGCGFVGPARIQQRRSGTRFDVLIAVERGEPCPAPSQPFKLTVPLRVYGIGAAGIYSYDVNGVIGNFELRDNVDQFSDDIPVTNGCRASGSC